jgi:hypothetical protein
MGKLHVSTLFGLGKWDIRKYYYPGDTVNVVMYDAVETDRFNGKATSLSPTFAKCEDACFWVRLHGC